MSRSNPCSKCGSPVAVRRPSQSGRHYCSTPECQVAKQNYYRKQKAERVKETAQQSLSIFLSALARRPRVECPSCGLPNAVWGWAHRNPDGKGACWGVGSKGAELPKGVLDAIHPERIPKDSLPPESSLPALP